MATDFIKLEDAIALTDQHCFESIYDAEWMEEALRDIPTANVVGKEEWDKLIFLVEEANKVLESAPKWISVKDRLPEPGERVLYCYRGFVGEGYVTIQGEWERAGIGTRYYPSHWMPLPEPPEMFDDIKENSKL